MLVQLQYSDCNRENIYADVRWVQKRAGSSAGTRGAVGIAREWTGKTKQIWQGSDLPTAPYRIITKDSDLNSVIADLGLPVIIKPVHEGSSVGMSKVEKAEDFAAAIEKATQHDAVVMAEKWITGREFTISFLNGQPLPVIRLQPPADAAFYDYEAKYQRDDVQYGIPWCIVTGKQIGRAHV